MTAGGKSVFLLPVDLELHLTTLKVDGQNSENSALHTCLTFNYHENWNLFMQFVTYLWDSSNQLTIITLFLFFVFVFVFVSVVVVVVVVSFSWCMCVRVFPSLETKWTWHRNFVDIVPPSDRFTYFMASKKARSTETSNCPFFVLNCYNTYWKLTLNGSFICEILTS